MPNTRKLQEIGKSLYISLPHVWARRMQLKKGSEVTLIQQPDDSISVYLMTNNEKLRQITLNIYDNESKQSIKRRVIGAYVDGFDLIKLKAEKRLSDEQYDLIREAIEGLFGLEVVEVSSNMVTAQCLLARTLPVEKILQKIHNILLSMFTEIISVLKMLDVPLARGVISRLHDVKRLSLVTHRLLRSRILFPAVAGLQKASLVECVDYLRVIDRITEIANNVNKIFESAIKLDEAFPRHILKYLDETVILSRNLYDWSIQALMTKDIPLANRVLDSKPDLEKLWKLCINADAKAVISSIALSYTHLIIDNLEQIQTYIAYIAEIAIDQAEAETKRSD